MLRYLAALLLTLAPLAAVAQSAPGAQQQALARGLLARDWSVAASPSLRGAAPDAAAVKALADLQLGHVLDSADAAADTRLCASGFYDLAHDGTFRLLALLDSSGRGFCTDLVLIGRGAHGTQAQYLHTWDSADAPNTDALLVTTAPGAPPALAVPELWWGAGLTQCAATWLRVYVWGGHDLIEVSGQMPAIYRARLAALAGAATPCASMEADRIRRFLGVAPAAGLAQAQGWMASGDPNDRSRAVAVLRDIATPAARADLVVLARADLAVLARDPNRAVAASAAAPAALAPKRPLASLAHD